MRIRTKLFAVLLMLTLAMVAGMLGFTQWSFEQGFAQLVERRQADRIERVRANLIEHYESFGDWGAMRNDVSHWLQALGRQQRLRADNQDQQQRARQGQRLQREGRRRQDRQQRVRRGRQRWLRDALNSPGEWPPKRVQRRFERDNRPLTLELRMMLLDASGEPVQARPDLLETATRRIELVSGDDTVGYLVITPGPTLREMGDIRFLERQTLHIGLIAIGAAVLSALLALWLAARMTHPLSHIQATARSLAVGDYSAKAALDRHDELGTLANDVDALATQLEANESARRQWVADISHELRTPIGVMRAELEALQDGVRPTNQGAVDSLHADVLRLQRLVDDLHELSVTDLGAMSYRMEPVDLMDVLTCDLDAFQVEFDTRGLELLRVGSWDSEQIVAADEGRLSQLFRNLLRNTLRYTDAPGKLTVEVSRPPGTRQLTVRFSDSAPGVPQEALEKLFERLYRVDESRNRSGGGAGLGLAICRNIAQAHGGTITATHSSDGGLRVTVMMPTA
ncbi:MAG: HAMP domain-containing protein [Chromatiales bacterium]|jgi:two-component system, OmpR family, sensor histidine kinase BaeS|nr:HAMP domain-containing protein [Chromatiales bacterium]